MNYTSEAGLFGLPLLHVAIGAPEGSAGSRGIAKGWIAVGDIAFGIVFAFGGIAIGGFSLGGLAVGVLALAGLSVGVWSLGGLALGAFAVGGCAMGLWASYGGLAVAFQYALGGLAIASDANTETARTYFASSTFFQVASSVVRHSRWLWVLAILGPIVTFLLRRRHRRAP